MAKNSSSVSEANDFAFRAVDDFLPRGVGDGAGSDKSSSGRSDDLSVTGQVSDNEILPISGDIADARDFNFTWAYDPHDTVSGLPDLATPPETLRDKPVYGLTGDWDATRPGDNNDFTQLDSGRVR